MARGNIKRGKITARIRDKGGCDCGVYASYVNYDGDQGEPMKAVVAT